MAATFLVALIALLAVPATSAGATTVDAHRGGPMSLGKAVYPENSFLAIGASAGKFRLEMDTRLTKDGQVVLMHDPLLDRTTTCTGPVRDKTFDELDDCLLDVTGSPGNGLDTGTINAPVKIPPLAAMLEIAQNEGAEVSIEINNYPGENEVFDSTFAQGGLVADVVLASGIPQKDVILQSFIAQNVNAAKAKLPNAQTALIALANSNESALDNAKAGGFDWLYPRWPLEDGLVANAHASGIKVSPYTLNSAAEVREAVKQGVDSVITDDPLMALRQIDTKAPRAAIAFTTTKLSRVQNRGKLPLQVGMNEEGELDLQLIYKGKEIADGFFVFEEKGRRKVKLALTRSGKRALKDLDEAKVTLRVTAIDVAGRVRESKLRAVLD